MIDILVVEDAKFMQLLYYSLLAGEGFACHHAGSLEEAFDLIKANLYRAVVLDLTLPDGKGEELLPFLSCPVFIVTGANDDRIGALDSENVTRVFRKPVDARELIAAVADAVGPLRSHSFR